MSKTFQIVQIGLALFMKIKYVESIKELDVVRGIVVLEIAYQEMIVLSVGLVIFGENVRSSLQ